MRRYGDHRSRLSVVLLLEYSSKKSLDIGLIRDGDVYQFLRNDYTINRLVSTHLYTALFLFYSGGGICLHYKAACQSSYCWNIRSRNHFQKDWYVLGLCTSFHDMIILSTGSSQLVFHCSISILFRGVNQSLLQSRLSVTLL